MYFLTLRIDFAMKFNASYTLKSVEWNSLNTQLYSSESASNNFEWFSLFHWMVYFYSEK